MCCFIVNVSEDEFDVKTVKVAVIVLKLSRALDRFFILIYCDDVLQFVG